MWQYPTERKDKTRTSFRCCCATNAVVKKIYHIDVNFRRDSCLPLLCICGVNNLADFRANELKNLMPSRAFVSNTTENKRTRRHMDSWVNHRPAQMLQYGGSIIHQRGGSCHIALISYHVHFMRCCGWFFLSSLVWIKPFLIPFSVLYHIYVSGM